MSNHRYSDFSTRINVDAFEEAINFQFIENDGKGNDVGYCPNPWNLHKNGDTTGKFAIHREKRVFNCWVCGGGTLLSLGMAVWNLSEDEAIDKLFSFCGEPTDELFEDEIEQLLRQDEQRRNPIKPYFNEHVLDQHIANIGDEWVWEWLNERGISDEIATTYKLGFDPAAKKISKKGEYQGPGILFPHFWQGRLVGWQTRWLDPDDARPPWVQKYNNTTDFPKTWTIYNYERVYFSEDPIVVVESVPTALYLESLGIAAIATFGASVTDEQLRLLRACQQGVILAPDNDKPGRKFSTSLTKYLEKYISVRVAEPVGEKDSGDDLADVSHDSEVIDHLRDSIDTGLL